MYSFEKGFIFIFMFSLLFCTPITAFASEQDAENIEHPTTGPNYIAPRAIIGNDTRRRVTSSELPVHPFSSVALLRVQFPNRSFYTSGFFIDSETVVTAGHCLYADAEGGHAEKVTVYSSTGKAYSVSVFEPNPDWHGGNTDVTDFGAIKINGSHPNNFGANYNGDIRNYELNVTGYPDNKTIMFTGTGDALTNTSYFKHDVDTTGGQSGSPVYYMDTLGGYVVGIHTGGNSANQYNVAVRYTTTIRDFARNLK